MSEIPSLDTTGEVWRGVMPGLGEVLVDPAGDVTTIVEPAPGTDAADAGEDPALRHAALRFGWGEALSWSRRGFDLAHGAAASPPPPTVPAPHPRSCLILSGENHEVAIALIELAKRGWHVLGDRYTPVLWVDDALQAQPREAPLLMSSHRLAKAELVGERVRLHSDSRRVDLPRVTAPCPVAAFCEVLTWKAGDEHFVELRGHERFEAAAGAFMRAPWSHNSTACESSNPASSNSEAASDFGYIMAEHLRLAQFPMARMYLSGSTAAQSIDLLTSWWSRVMETTAEDS